jgi:hypothetical protein
MINTIWFRFLLPPSRLLLLALDGNGIRLIQGIVDVFFFDS